MASDGQEGWQAVLDHAPDLVFTDCQMPYVNGLELAERIKNNPETCHIPVYMLTAKGFELSEDVAIEQYGIRKIIAKPFSPRALVTEAEAVLSQDSATESPATADEGTA